MAVLRFAFPGMGLERLQGSEKEEKVGHIVIKYVCLKP